MPNEKQAGPDMSVLFASWKPDSELTQARLFCPADRPLILEMEIKGARAPQEGRKICLLRATTREEELWAVRLQNYRLVLQPGTGTPSRIPLTAITLSLDFKLSISFDPILGGIVLATDFTNQVLGDKCRNAWVDFYDRMGRTPEDVYRVTVGCPLDGRADLPPLGWTISAKYRFGPKYAQGTADALRLIAEDKERKSFAEEIREAPRGQDTILTAIDRSPEERAAHTAALSRLYARAAEGADHTELSAEWHLGVVAGARSQGWKGGKP